MERPAPGQPSELAVRAGIEVPECMLAMTRLLRLEAVTTIRRNPLKNRAQEVAKNKATSCRGCLPISPEPKK